MSSVETPSRLRVDGVSRVFGSLVALDNISVEFTAGQVHAVVGENGAGKSTLMNILGGFLMPSGGTVTLDGASLLLGNPQQCRANGIEMVHQHFKLVPAFTIRENLRLSQLGIGKTNTLEIETMAQNFGWDIPWDSRVRDVSVGIQQRVEILKCVATDPKVVIFDEPTAVLSDVEVDDLIQFMRRLAAEGKIVLLIAHKIEEVLRASDVITVLRRGNHVGTKPRSEFNEEELVEMMVGETVITSSAQAPMEGTSGLQVQGLYVKGDLGQDAVQGVDLTVPTGTVVGIGGVDGNGQVEFAEAVAGVRECWDGTFQFLGQPLDRLSCWIGYVPQDRHVDGLALSLDLVENIAVSGLSNGRKFDSRLQAETARNLIQKFGIKARSERDRAVQLSGGNQQKVILARVLNENPKILVVVNPTRGLDVKAANFVHSQIRDAAAKGASVLVITTDRDELAQISDVRWYMSRGRLYANEAEALAS